MNGQAEIRDAATILLHRKAPDTEFFMVKRHAKSSFMANAMVFPGGHVEEGDADLSWLTSSDLSERDALERMATTCPELATSLLVAAVRETFEEAGILLASIANQPLLSSEHAILLTEGRRRLNAGETSFYDLATDFDLTLHLSTLRYLSRWVTPPIASRRFDARFFIAEAPEGQQASSDLKETSEGLWIRPEDALARYADGESNSRRPLFESCSNFRSRGAPRAPNIANSAGRTAASTGKWRVQPRTPR